MAKIYWLASSLDETKLSFTDLCAEFPLLSYFSLIEPFKVSTSGFLPQGGDKVALAILEFVVGSSFCFVSVCFIFCRF